MKTIRTGTFETNSSSTHSITMCMESDIQDWKDGKKLYVRESDSFYKLGEELDKYLSERVIDSLYEYKDSKRWYKGIGYDWGDNTLYSDENIAEITQEQRDKWLEECDDDYTKPMNYSEFWDSLEYETYEETFTTPNGEKVVAFGYYGQDY